MLKGSFLLLSLVLATTMREGNPLNPEIKLRKPLKNTSHACVT